LKQPFVFTVFRPKVASEQESTIVKQGFDVIVVGVGSMGAATCCYLARRGVRVLGLEQFGIPHALGAHHGHTRMIRMAYFEQPDYVPLVKRAYELWGELEEQSGEKLLYLTGGLYLGDQQSQMIAGAVAASEQHGLRYQVLDHAELQQKFPQFRLPSSHQGFFEDRAGVLLPEKVVATFAEQAMCHGAELHGHEPVEDWSSDSQGVTVRTKLNTYQADCVVFTGGAWSEKLLVDFGVHLNVTRQVLAWFWPRRTEPFALGTLPAWYLDTDNGYGHYGFPLLSGQPGFKIALHKPATVTDPDHVDRDVQPEEIEGLRSILQEHIPEAVGPLVSASVCLYSNSPDSHFIIDRHPQNERVWLACGFSGHGFKFSSVVGEALADLATSGTTGLPVGFLGLSRFGE
jgi:sarcosine oxidase